MAEKTEKKFTSIKDLAKKVNKEYGNENVVRRSDVIPAYERLRSGALGMDYPLYGGLPKGRICVYSGKQHSGKSTAAMRELAAYQSEHPDKLCIYVDAEHALDIKFQTLMNNVDLDKLFIFSPPTGMSGEQILAEILTMQLEADDIGLIVIDSIPALVTAQNLKNDFTKDTGKQGTIAKPMHKFITEIIPSLEEKQNILILINQVRIKDVLYNGAPIYSEPGGDAPKFYSSVSVRFGTRTFMKGDTEIQGENKGEGATGFKLKFDITKNKTAPTNRGGGFITYDYVNGLNYLDDMLQVALTFDFIQRVNNVTYQLINLETGEILVDEEGKELRGKKTYLIDYFNKNLKFKEWYFNMLVSHISASNTLSKHLLSEEEEAEIKAEEANIKVLDD